MNYSTGPERGGPFEHWDTFIDAPRTSDAFVRSRAVIVPVPYDATTSYKSGSRHGPKAIITASRQLENYDLELDRDISDVGIYTASEIESDVSSPQNMVDRVEKAVRPVCEEGKLVGLLGGEHTITIGAVKALRKYYPDVSVLYLDAHADLRDEYMGSQWSHACVARRLSEFVPLALVGVRSLSFPEAEFIRDKNLPVLFWPSGYNDTNSLVDWSIDKLTEDVYISIDLDVLDPSLMSAVGTPEPGGMRWEQITEFLHGIATAKRIVGFDITELSPGEGPEACSFTAAKLAYKLVGYATNEIM